MNAGALLIVRVGAMGDVLHALPALAGLRQLQPTETIDWLVDPRWAPLLVNEDGVGPVVSRVHLAETKLWSRQPLAPATLRSIRALRQELRAERYPMAVDLQGTLRSAVLGGFARARDFAGYADPREAVAGWFYRRRLRRRGTHVVEQAAALLGDALNLAIQPAVPALPREEWAEHWAEDLVAGQRVCVLAAAAGWEAKHWPVERYAELARELRRRGFRVLANAPRKDNPIATRLADQSGGAAEVTVCNVTGLLALLRRAAVVVGGDSGPVHLAATLGVPVVALFGPTDPARNGPWGPGPQRVLRHPASVTSYRHVAEIDPGLAQIRCIEVLQAVMDLAPAGR